MPSDFLKVRAVWKDISIVYAYRCTPAGSAGACGSLDMHVDLCVYGLHPSMQNTTSFVSQKAQRVVGWGAHFRVCYGACRRSSCVCLRLS